MNPTRSRSFREQVLTRLRRAGCMLPADAIASTPEQLAELRALNTAGKLSSAPMLLADGRRVTGFSIPGAERPAPGSGAAVLLDVGTLRESAGGPVETFTIRLNDVSPMFGGTISARSKRP